MQADIAVCQPGQHGQQPIHDPADAFDLFVVRPGCDRDCRWGREVYRNGHLTTIAEDIFEMRMDQFEGNSTAWRAQNRFQSPWFFVS